jgi:O-antigen/teichoic acid export membrane protein
MLIGQASINLTANVLSALLGFACVFVFTRLFSPHEYGNYLLGLGFAAVVSVFLVGWFRNLILSGHARNDGTDVRGLVISGYLVCCLTAPVIYVIGRLLGMDAATTWAAVGLSIAIGLFELSQDLVRARLKAFSVMKATLVRAAALLGFGALAALSGPTGFVLLCAATAAYLLAVLVQSRTAWRGTHIKFERAALADLARTGLPLTLSLTLLAISTMADRFIIAGLVGTGDAGKYVAGLDLVRQTLMMPAMSAAAAFFPLAVQIHARQGDAAVRSHLAECNIVLGPEFRELAAQTMPIVAIAVIFQILTQQYLHASFLLSGRNSFYLINTVTIIAANLVLSFALVTWLGTVGAAWARLGADIVGFACALLLSRFAFKVPFPLRPLALMVIASLAMALIVATLQTGLRVSDLAACVILVAAGAASYAFLAWLFDVARARSRTKRVLDLFRTKFANSNIG